MPTVSTDVPEYQEPERLSGRYAFRCIRSVGQMEDDGVTLRNLILTWSCIDGPPLKDGESAMGREVTQFIPFYEKESWKDNYKASIKELKSKLFSFSEVDPSNWDTDTEFLGKELWAVCRPGEDINGLVVDQIRNFIGPYED